MVSMISTGIPGLDEITGGGLPRPAAVALVGEAGSGKSLLARQISWSLLKQGFNVLYYSVDESADDVRDGMRSFGWDITRFEEEDRFHFIDVFSIGTEVSRTRPEAHPDECIDSVFNFTELLKEGQDFCL